MQNEITYFFKLVSDMIILRTIEASATLIEQSIKFSGNMKTGSGFFLN